MSFSINRNNLTHGLRLADGVGVEIGPLVNPVITREMSNVKYIDRASTEELRQWYSRDEKINVNEIMNIDYVWGEQSLAEATGGVEQFDYCVASHVIEHIPDLITWLGEIASILKPGGIASFAVPDKRYTFDCKRADTTAADLVENYLRKLRKPSYRHIFDHFSNFVEVDINTAWSEGFDPDDLKPSKSAADTYRACLEARDQGRYVDSHCSVFTEPSFFDLLGVISELGFLDFRIKRNFSVRRGMFEFFVQLEKLEPGLSTQSKYQQYCDSLEQMLNTGLELQFSANTACHPKLYFSHSGGFNETESIEAAYPHAGNREILNFPLPQLDSPQLRFDPAEVAAEFSIISATLRNGSEIISIAPDSWQPAQQIAATEITHGELRARTNPDANDPALTLQV
ncbi:MAG: methyltransferase domain-containing protein [Gammaproteobacteria bacterium]|nr:methyltransferase domain-containing protein [Gammaproteobacteria bacterium]